MSSKRTKRRKEPKNKEVKKDLTPQFVNCDLADHKYAGIIREDLLGSQFLEGTASYIWSSGTKYEGPFVASQIEGRGTFVWNDGSKYEGELLGGRRNGEGCYISHDGKTRYVGQWLDGKRHGQGKLTYSSEGPSFYDGGWQAGQKHGYGKQLWPSGNCYEGEWKLGKMHGFGTMFWKNGSSAEIYTGEWVENCPHGEGTHTWLTLDRPESTTESWLNQPSPPPSAGGAGAPNGPPSLTNANAFPQELRRHEAQMHATQQLNNRYTGQWVWGRRQGVGTFYYANGAYYSGEWKSNVKDGNGRHTFDDGKVYDGKFEADRMVDYSKPELSKEENPVCGCTDISDLEVILRPSDKIGLVKAPLIGFAEPAKMLKGIFNVLLRHLGDLREAYSRSRAVQPLLGEDPHLITLVQFWSLARDAGILTPNSCIARFDRAIFSGPRHQSEVAPEDEKDVGEPLTPRRPKSQSAPRPGSKDSTMTRHRTSSTGESKSTEDEMPLVQEDDQSDLDAYLEEICVAFDSPGGSSSSLGGKYVRKCTSDGNLVHIHAPARPFLFRHFLESFIRMAPMRFPHEPGLEQQVQRLFKEQVMPALKNVSSHKSEGGGLISMLANFRRPTSSVFGLFTQPEVREVVYELEPTMWNIFVELSGDPEAKEAINTIPGGGVFAGAGGLGANPSNQVPRLKGDKRQPPPQEPLSSCPPEAVRCGDWAAPSRRLHVAARLNVGVRIKDVLRFLELLGLLDDTQILKDQSRPLAEVLSGSEGDPVNNLLGPVGSGLAQEEPVEEENVSEDDEGSGGSVAPEDDEDRKQLPGLSISFMPKGSLLGVPPPPPKEESKSKRKGDKDKKDKKEEKEVRTPAEDMAQINLTIDAIDALRIMTQVLTPSSLELLQWHSEQDGATEVPNNEIDEHVTILEFVESEIVFAEFLRFWFLMAELTTRRDYKFCRSIPLTTRLDLFLRTVISYCQLGHRYVVPDPNPYVVSEKPEKGPKPRNSFRQGVIEEAPEIPGVPEIPVEIPEKVPAPERWMGFDGDDSCAPRRWPEGYDVQVADW